MTKKMLMLGLFLTLIFTLNGCYSDDPLPRDDSAAEVPISSFSESSEETTEEMLEADVAEVTQNQAPVTSTQEETEYSKDIAETSTTTVSTKTENPKSDDTENVNKPTKQPEQQTEDNNPPAESKPIETNSTAPEPDSPTKQEEEAKEQTKTETTEPPKESEPEFDINYWTNFAKGYAQSIGLSLDSTATECWDNPISANPKRTNIEADIVSRLNRYKNVEEFTAVWIWVEKVSDTEYEIYIGYA